MLPYYNENDSMNRTNVRNSILLILSKDNAYIENYFTQLPAVTYFVNIAYRLAMLTEDLQSQIRSASKEVKMTIEEIINEAGQINEILHLRRKKVNFVLLNALFGYYINPCLLSRIVFTSITKENGDESSAFALFVLNLLLKMLNEEVFMNILFTLLFCKVTVFNKGDFTAKPKQPFCYKYEFDYPYQKETFDNFILYNYSHEFITSLIESENVLMTEFEFNETKKIKKVLTLKNNEYKNKCTQDKNKSLHKDMGKYVQKKLLKNVKNEIKEKHLILSEFIGKNVGFIDEQENMKLQRESFMGKMLMLYDGVFHYNEFNINFIRTGLQRLLMEDGEGNVNKMKVRYIILNKLFICVLIYNCINRNVSEFIMKMCLMYNFNKINLTDEYTSKFELTNDNNNEYKLYMFNNNYFSNAKSNQQYIQLSQGIITFIFNILSVEQLNNIIYPTIIYDIAVTILHHLIGEPNDVNDNIHNINKTFISNIYVNIVSTRYQQILTFLKDNISIISLCVVEFYKEWKQYNLYNINNTNNDIKSLFECPEKHLLPYLTVNYDYNKSNSNMKFKNYFHLFMIYHDILAKIKGNELIVHAFPLLDIDTKLINKKIMINSKEFIMLLNKEGIFVMNGTMYTKTSIKEKNGWMFIIKNIMYIGVNESNNTICVFKEMFILNEIKLEKDDIDFRLKIINEKEVKYEFGYYTKNELDNDYEKIIKIKKNEEINAKNEFENYIQMVWEKEIKVNNNN